MYLFLQLSIAVYHSSLCLFGRLKPQVPRDSLEETHSAGMANESGTERIPIKQNEDKKKKTLHTLAGCIACP